MHIPNLRHVSYWCGDLRVWGWSVDYSGRVWRRIRAAAEPDHLLVILHPDAYHNNRLRRVGAVVDTTLVLRSLSHSEVEGTIGSTSISDIQIIGFVRLLI